MYSYVSFLLYSEPMSIHNPSAQPDHRSSVSTFPAEDLRSPDHHSTTTTFEDELANQALESIHTKLYGPLDAPFFTYNTVPWTLHVRKEVCRLFFILVKKKKKKKKKISFWLIRFIEQFQV